MNLEELYEMYHFMISEKYSQSQIEELLEIISGKESDIFEFNSGDSGVIGIGVNVGPGGSSNPIRTSGISGLNGVKSDTNDIQVPFNSASKNRVFQKIPVPMGKGHGARTGKKSRVKGLDLKAMRDMLKNRKNKDTDMKPRTQKVMNFDDFQKGEVTRVTKVKEGKAYKSSKPDKKIGKEGLKLTDKKENFRTEVKNLVKSHDEFSIKQVGNDLSINKGSEHILQVMFRDDYVGIQKVGNKFPKEFKYNELGKIKSEITSILKSSK